jgi:hypothetical protein
VADCTLRQRHEISRSAIGLSRSARMDVLTRFIYVSIWQLCAFAGHLPYAPDNRLPDRLLFDRGLNLLILESVTLGRFTHVLIQ